MDEQVRRYLDQFRSNLKHVPAAERDDMVREMESHIAEAVGSGRDGAEVLGRLGPADKLARAMAAEAMLNSDRGPRIRRWFAILGLLTYTGLPGLVLVPLLAIFGLALLLVGLLTALASLYSLFFAPWAVDTSIRWLNHYPLAQLWSIFCSGLIVSFAWGCFWLIRQYMRFLTTAARNVLH